MEDLEEKELRKNFYSNLGWYFSEKTNIRGAVNIVSEKIGGLSQKLDELNSNLVKADESSSELTKALNNITKWGVIIAAGGLVVAALTLCLGLASFIFEIIKYINGS